MVTRNLREQAVHRTALTAGWPRFLQGEGCGCTGAHNRERGRSLPPARGRPQVRLSLASPEDRLRQICISPLKPAPASFSDTSA